MTTRSNNGTMSWNGFTINCPLNADGTNNADPTKWTISSIIGGSIWNSTWWPVIGGRNFANTLLGGVGAAGRCWTSSSYPSVAYSSHYLDFYYDGIIFPDNAYHRSGGFPIRCVQE